MIELTGVHHTSFTVSDMARSLAFYRDLLGLKVTVDRVSDTQYLRTVVGYPEAKLHLVYLELPSGSDHILELIQYLSPPGTKLDVATKNVGAGHLCFKIADIHQAYEYLKSNGVEFMSPPTLIDSGRNTGAYCCYMHDPDGITIELMQPPPRPT